MHKLYDCIKLCHDFTGIVLPKVHFYSNLNSQGNPIDSNMKENNSAHIGKLPEKILLNSGEAQLYCYYIYVTVADVICE